ncbi:hypothetical protein PISMIDRAFT_670754 [Pisolithus microcarpus 441]|uniref:Uncharacterized protein n=1 Tax=Pisolithus microcarpus 441 TaxID=765257 RepID=A0A0C9ZX64_9AGAM|nr:hypothetical protein PISMIDRAFT_670754 [Pisolithus microcarpus 441]
MNYRASVTSIASQLSDTAETRSDSYLEDNSIRISLSMMTHSGPSPLSTYLCLFHRSSPVTDQLKYVGKSILAAARIEIGSPAMLRYRVSLISLSFNRHGTSPPKSSAEPNFVNSLRYLSIWCWCVR